MPECELRTRCGFFRNHADGFSLGWKGFVTAYCRGSRMKDCRRREYFETHGKFPPDDLLPSGKKMPGGPAIG